MKTPALIAALVAAGLVSTGAHAQQERPWLKDRRYGEGVGIRTGDVELHPGAAVEFGYDSNYFQRAGDPPDATHIDEVSVLLLRPTLSLSLSTLGAQRRAFDAAGREPPKVNFTAGVGSQLLRVPLGHAGTRVARQGAAQPGRQCQRQARHPARGPWGGDLLGDFQRTIQPSNDPNVRTFNRDTVRRRAGIIWRPGGGMFDWRLGYEFELTTSSNPSTGT